MKNKDFLGIIKKAFYKKNKSFLIKDGIFSAGKVLLFFFSYFLCLLDLKK